eukprot:TRINITY_DN60387_c0_g1_i1.p2 TRINITY_DN60387_c0_g1~~TRINITY_DN60387_c0_g1_i1.p2  ORF type:complete len:128 (+),score=12.76 TRINITY_DN60387_c0_g1_i1:105-488(+)
MDELQFLGVEQVANLLKGPDRDKAVIIDVRGHDFNELGHIKGCLNIVSDEFDDDDNVDQIIEEHLNGKEKVILHCWYCKQRGPHCAYRLQSRLRVAERSFPEVYVLEGGFRKFGSTYYGDEELVVKA